MVLILSLVLPAADSSDPTGHLLYWTDPMARTGKRHGQCGCSALLRLSAELGQDSSMALVLLGSLSCLEEWNTL